MGRPIRYCRQSLMYGRDFGSDDDLDAQTFRWMEAAAMVSASRHQRPQMIRSLVDVERRPLSVDAEAVR